MQLEFAFLCDYANGGARGTINALGIGINTIVAPQVPHKTPHFHLVFQLTASTTEVGRKQVAINLIDADGKPIVSQNVELDIPKPRPGELQSRITGNVGFGNVEFPAYGNYSVHLTIAGIEMTHLPLRIVEPPRTA